MIGHRRGRPFKPKHKVRCPKCGWKGTRGTIAKRCPGCGHWHPEKVYEPNAAEREEERQRLAREAAANEPDA